MILNEICRERLVSGMLRALSQIFDSDLSEIDQKNYIRKATHDLNLAALGMEDSDDEDGDEE